MNKTELLLPVGNKEMCYAAIHNGADAIYVGMPGFNARGRSYDHEWGELEEIVDYCHLYGVKVHLAFNILIFEDELKDALFALDKAVNLGIDALIIQDLGLACLIRKRYPKLVLHGSTQMSISNHEAIKLLDDLDIKRFVLARENSITEIKQIKENTNKELEVFVHGALCVAYSGQCFTSEALGGRSANRGQCAQSCRFDYELFVDGTKNRNLEKKYLLSPKDLCGIDHVKELVDIGVDSFKIEGRLKSVEYVGTAAKAYHQALKNNEVNETMKSNMAISYSRGFYTGWLNGVAHQELVSGDSKSNQGLYLGKAKIKSGSDEIILKTKRRLINGDGLMLKSHEAFLGEKIYELKESKGSYSLKLGPKFKKEILKSSEVDVYLNRHEKIIKDVKKSYTDKEIKRRVPITISLYAKVGELLKAEVWCDGHRVVIYGKTPLEKAESKKIDHNDLKLKLKSLSHTVYYCQDPQLYVDSNVFIHLKTIKEIKREFVSILNQKRTYKNIYYPKDISLKKDSQNTARQSKLNILLRKKEQVISLSKLLFSQPHYKSYIGKIILDFEFGKDYFSSIKLIKEFNIKSAIATTRILKPGEYHNFRLIERCEPDEVLVRNLGALFYFKDKDIEISGDFSLNCANSYSFDYLEGKGLSSICASYDLNLDQLNLLIDNVDASKLEITTHQYMPEFHMEHCVFAAFMSKGNSFRDCGKPCEKHEVYLKDMYGNRHEIKADQECRNTMYKSKAQSTLKFIEEWKHKGVGQFRFECLHESNEELTDKIEIYLRYLMGEVSIEKAYELIGPAESYGVSTGQLENKKKFFNRR